LSKLVFNFTLTAFAVLATSANAETRCTSSGYYLGSGGGQTVCNTYEPQRPAPKLERQVRAEAAEREAKIAKWEAFCQPTKKIDSDGMVRLTYAHKG